MKKHLLSLIIICCTPSLSAQNTWFKFVPGWQGNNSYIFNDTIYSFCPTSNFDPNLIIGININKTNITGQTYTSDSLFYFSDILQKHTNLEYRTKNNSIRNNNTILFASNYGDSIGSDIKWQSDLFFYPSFEKLNFDLNYDTFSTRVDGLFLINDFMYALVNWQRKLDKLNTLSSSRVLRINNDKTTNLIYTRVNTSYNQNSHDIQIENIHPDNQNGAYLLLQILDRWDFHGVPAQFEAVIQKIDTTGKLIWESHPVGDQDSINTTDFQMVQLPNGNILCSWLDFYYRPWKKPGDPYQYEEINDNATLWFAEIDYKTGKKIWIKNIDQYLKRKMEPTDIDGRIDVTNIILTDAILSDDNSVVWCGYRGRTVKLTNSWKNLPILLKTDYNGNPIWYREYDFYPSDTGDKGFKPFSFVHTPDKGFLLTGEYHNRFGQLSNGAWWQKAALLKLDSNGCFTPGCNATDNIINMKVPKNICMVYPNPANTYLQIECPKDFYGWGISILDIDGKEVLKSQEAKHRISTSHLPNGIYSVQLTKKNQYHHETHKIIIKH
jgi:hypothetical protein